LSTVEEMVPYVEGGLTSLEALQSGTLNPAIFLNATDSLGTVAPGKLADLVLLNGNPLLDIHNVLKLLAVVAHGRYFDRATLDAMDPDGIRLGGLVAARSRTAPDTTAITKPRSTTP
jgi:adenine deaminase